jgi:hypothetical protein
MHVKKNRTTSAGKSGIASHVKTVAAVSALLVAAALRSVHCPVRDGLRRGQEDRRGPEQDHAQARPDKNLDMDEEGMTMVFRVQDPSALKQVKIGDKVKFAADRVNGQVT